jgi:hypothetical protein
MEISNNGGVQKCHPIDIQLPRVMKVDQYDKWQMAQSNVKVFY